MNTSGPTTCASSSSCRVALGSVRPLRRRGNRPRLGAESGTDGVGLLSSDTASEMARITLSAESGASASTSSHVPSCGTAAWGPGSAAAGVSVTPTSAHPVR